MPPLQWSTLKAVLKHNGRPTVRGDSFSGGTIQNYENPNLVVRQDDCGLYEKIYIPHLYNPYFIF